MNRILKITALIAVLGLVMTSGRAQAQLVTATELFVDLRANDFTTQSDISVWTNHGTLPDFHKFFNDAGEDTNIVGQYDITRGVQFRSDDDGFLPSADGGATITNAPAGLIGESDWSVEVWVWTLPQGGEQCVVGIGQRNGPVESQAQLCVGGIAFVGWGEDYNWIDNSLGGDNTPTDEEWHHVVWTYNGNQIPGDTADSGNGGANEGADGQVLIYVDGQLAVSDTNLNNPLDIGDLDGTPKPLNAIGIGGTLQGVGNVTLDGGASWANGNNNEGGINRVRIHDGTLSPADVLNNYNEDIANGEFSERPQTPQPRIFWRNPTSGRVINFGDGPAGTTITETVTFLTRGGADTQVDGYSITGPDAGLFSINPAAPPTGAFSPNTTISFDVNFVPTDTTEVTATLNVDFGTTLGIADITLRGNVTRVFVATPASGGSDSSGTGSQVAPFGSLGKALEEVEPGDIISMGPGTYGLSSSPDLADGSRQVDVIGSGAVTILIAQVGGTSFDVESNQFPNPNVPPPPPGVFLPAPDPLAQVRDWNDTTMHFENITFDAAFDTANDEGDEPFRLNGSGTFDVSFTNCTVLNNWGTAALQGNLNGPDNPITLGGIKPIIRLTADGTTFRGDGPNESNASVLLQAELVEVDLSGCDLRSGGTNLNVVSTIYAPTIDLTGTLFGALSPANIPTTPINVFGSASPATFTMDTVTFSEWGDAAIASFNTRSDITATNCVFTTSQGNWGVFQNQSGATMDFSNTIFSGPVTSHVNSVEGGFHSYVGVSMSGSSNDAIRINDAGGVPNYTVQVIGSQFDGGSLTFGEGLDNRSSSGNVEIIIDRSTFRAGGSPGDRGPAVRTNFVDNDVTVSNSVFEGWNVVVSNNETIPNINLINNTIVGLSDGEGENLVDTDSGFPDTTVTLVNNIVVGGYATLVVGTTNTVTQTNLIGSDPRFASPNPFSPPDEISVSNYFLTSPSPAIGAGTDMGAAFAIDRDGVDRGGFAAWDIGAYQFNGAANPVQTWTWF